MAEADHAQQQERRYHQQNRIREGADAMVVDVRNHEHHAEREQRVYGLSFQKVLRVAKRNRGFDRGRAVHHDHAESDQRNHDGGEHDIHLTEAALR